MSRCVPTADLAAKSMPGKKSRKPEEFGRGLPDVSMLRLDQHIEISPEVINSALTEDKRDNVRGIHLVMSIHQLPAPSKETEAHEYKLMFANKLDATVATIRTEEASYKNDANRTKSISIAITEISKQKGAEDSRATHLLAAALGDHQGKRLKMLADAMPSDTTLEIKLLFDTDREERAISSYWEFEAAIEKQLNPYERVSRGAKIKLSSAW